MAESERPEESGVELPEYDQGPGIPPAPALPKPTLRKVKQSDTPERIAEIYGVGPDAIKGEVRKGKVVQVDTANANPIGSFLRKTGEILSLPGDMAVGLAKGAYDLAEKASTITKRGMEGEGFDPAEVFGLTLEVGAGGVLTSAATKTKGSLGMFLGPQSKNLSPLQKKNMIKAKQMLEEGADKQKVWDETNWAMDPLGNMRTELPGNKIKLNFLPVMEKFVSYKKARSKALDDAVINHADEFFPVSKSSVKITDVWEGADELLEHYPQLKDLRIRFGDSAGGAHMDVYNREVVFNESIYNDLIGWQKQINDATRRNAPDEVAKAKKGLQGTIRWINDTMRHEIHHAIADIEQWPLGNSVTNANAQARNALQDNSFKIWNSFAKNYEKVHPNSPIPNLLRAARAEADNALVPGSSLHQQAEYLKKYFPNEYNEVFLNEQASRWVKHNRPKRTYLNDRGEVDARNVEIRDSEGAGGRSYKYHPERTQDVSEERIHSASDPKNYLNNSPVLKE